MLADERLQQTSNGFGISTISSLPFANYLEADMSHKNGRFINCKGCGKLIYRSLSNLDRRFCNQKCYGKYMAGKPQTKVSEKGKKNISESRKGSKNPSWKGGTSFIFDRGQEWHEIRKIVYKRDNWKCRYCGKHCENKNIHAHHIESCHMKVENILKWREIL